MGIAIAYAETAIEDTKQVDHCKWIRLAAKRFIADLKKSQGRNPPYYFSAKRANEACWFIENIPHVEGEWELPTLLLVPAQLFFVVQLFGFRSKSGGRRFTEALYAIARKNAKSTLAAAILLCIFCLEPEEGPQILSAATTGSQARVMWNLAKRMVEKTPGLRENFDVEAFSNSIQRAEVGGIFKPINAKASTQDGLNPSACGLDEIHAHTTHDLINVLRSAAGARGSPLFLYTTTEGYLSPGPWPELRNFARQVLEGLFKADHFLAIIFALDEKDDEFDERNWIKANPLIATNPKLLDEMRKIAVNAKGMPGTHAEFLIKRCNRQAASGTSWVNLAKWKKCSGTVPLEALKGVPCVAAFDLASTRDMCAWRLLWMLDGMFYTWGRYWVPSDAVQQRTIRQSTPYAAWVRSGLLTQTEGDATDYAIVERDILADCAIYSPTRIGFDPWNATSTANNLLAEGLPLEQFIQGPRSYNPAMKAMEVAYTRGRLCHGGNSILTWNAANMVARKDVNLNEAPDRKRSADKIDGICCLAMCFGLLAADDSAAFDHMLKNIVAV